MSGVQIASEKHWSWFEQEVNRHYLKFTEKCNVNLFIGTWNVNAKAPKNDISSWLFPSTNTNSEETETEQKNSSSNSDANHNPSSNIDMYVLGFQEIVDLNAANLWIENDANVEWEHTIEKLIPMTEFSKLASRHLVGILLLVYARKRLLPHIRGLQSAQCGVGLFGTAGNKGGVGVRMQLYDSYVCFICAHLAAHKNNVQGRNQDYHKILENLKFHSSEAPNAAISSNVNDDDFDDQNLIKNVRNLQAQTQSQAQNSSNSNSNSNQTMAANESSISTKSGGGSSNNNSNSAVSGVTNVVNLLSASSAVTQIATNTNTENSNSNSNSNSNNGESGSGSGSGGSTTIYEWSILNDHDMVFWLGDLNYRLNFESLEQVYIFVEARDWMRMKVQDQLTEQKRKGLAFSGFQEHNIEFQPTYKFQPKTSDYERRAEKKTRFPAWCDRILWRHGLTRTTNIDDVKCLAYDVSMSQTMSDHKPVYGLFTYSANKYDLVKKKLLKKEIMKSKDKTDNHQRPKIEIESEVSFPFIKFGEVAVKDFVIHNTGQVHVSFRFTHPHNQKSLPDWLKISPKQGTILCGEKASVKFEISVTCANVVRNLPKHSRLEQTCLLRIETNSSETNVVPTKFVVVSATYLPSCFANRIENLVKYKKPIRFISDLENFEASQMMSNKDSVLSIPKELWRLVDHLYKYGLDTEQIFVRPGVLGDVMRVRECLDTGKVFGQIDLLSVGYCLVLWFERLQEPVFPESLCVSFNDNLDITQWCRSALMSLPLSHYNSFIYAISFLREVLRHSSKNKLKSEQLAFTFSSALMQSRNSNIPDLNKHKPFRIFLHFLRNDLFLT